MPDRPLPLLRLTPTTHRADVLVTTPLCAACPYSPAGCCAAPPRVALADIARIVLRGGRDFLLEEIAAGRLVPGKDNAWLNLPRRLHASGVAACVYLGEAGCRLSPERRSVTCNVYVCEEVLARAEGDAGQPARTLRDTLETDLARWDAELEQRTRVRWPAGHQLDADFLDWLGGAFAELLASDRD